MNPKQLEKLVLMHQNALELFASQWTSVPEDCVQEAFLKLFRQNQTVTNPKAWLFRVVRNLAIDSGRSETARKNRESKVGQKRKLFSDSYASLLDPEELRLALESLRPDEREVIVARIWGKLTLEEIGSALDIATSTAHRRYNNGINQLQKHFEVLTEKKHDE